MTPSFSESGGRRLLVIVNPRASSTSERLARQVIALLSRGHEVQGVQTRAKGHAVELARQAAQDGYDAVVALGGDGTINEAVNGLMGSATVLACLPGGATNVYCRMLGLSRSVTSCAEHVSGAATAWKPRSVDVGMLNQRFFAFSAGVGLDASVVERVDRRPDLKARWGPWFFAAVGLAVFTTRYLRRPPRLEIDFGNGEMRAVSALFQNGSPYTFFGERPILLDPEGGLNSGVLGGVSLSRASALDLPPVLWRALSGRRPVSGHPQVELVRARALVVRSVDGRPVPVQVDGDHIGDELEARLSVVPGGLRVLA